VKDETDQNALPRKRYVLVNDQVRRLPVAFVIVVDQAHRSDVLAAVASSKLRIQTTQVYWKHRELPATAPASGDGKPPVVGVPTVGVPPIGGGDRPKADTSTPSEANRNMIELTIHGIASLYERFPPKAPSPPPETPGAPK